MAIVLMKEFYYKGEEIIIHEEKLMFHNYYKSSYANARNVEDSARKYYEKNFLEEDFLEKLERSVLGEIKNALKRVYQVMVN